MIKIIPYQKQQKHQIQNLFKNVFTESENEEHGSIVSHLVGDIITLTDDQDIYGFIAKNEKELIASIFFTRLHFEENIETFILSPVAVKTNFQNKGIGKNIINFGIKKLKQQGIGSLFTYGDPNFYAKVGFKHVNDKIIQAPYPLSQPHGWLYQSLNDDKIKSLTGTPVCVDAFDKAEYW